MAMMLRIRKEGKGAGCYDINAELERTKVVGILWGRYRLCIAWRHCIVCDIMFAMIDSGNLYIFQGV
jgi:hypothetical protein